MKKFVSFISILLSLILLASCSKASSKNDDYDHTVDFTPEDGEIFMSVPTGRYDGFEFCILNARTASNASLMDTDTVEGDLYNEALLVRNLNVEERLDIEISEVIETPDNVLSIAIEECLAGTNVYSAVCNNASHMATMSVSGYLVPDTFLTGMDPTKPWWNDTAISNAAADSVRYFFFGDLQLSYYDAHYITVMNEEMLGNIDGIKDVHKLVESGKWTLDEMLIMMDEADSDFDGNGTLTWEDRYGIALENSTILPLTIGCNTFFSEKDEYGLPTLTCFTDDVLYDVFSHISKNLYTQNPYVYNREKNDADGMSTGAMFKYGNTLFHVMTIGELANLRTMDIPFSLLPMPKYFEDQENYVSLISATHATAIGVLKTDRDLQRTSIILENLAAESHRSESTRNCYINSVLSYEYIDAVPSRKNLDTVLASGAFEFSQIYGWGGICDKYCEIAGKTESYSSTLASVRIKAISEVSDTIVAVNENNK